VVSGGLHCTQCGRDGHVEAFYYRKKKAQAHRSSQGTSDTGSGGFERSSAGSETHEILMLLHHLAASTSTGVVGTVTQSSALIGSAATSQSSTLGPPTAPSPGTYSWYLDSSVSFHDSSFCSSFFFMTFSPLHCLYRQWIPSFCSWTGHSFF
jgi:hypothetical protein